MLKSLPTSGNLTAKDIKANRLMNKAIKAMNDIDAVADCQETSSEANVLIKHLEVLLSSIKSGDSFGD